MKIKFPNLKKKINFNNYFHSCGLKNIVNKNKVNKILA